MAIMNKIRCASNLFKYIQNFYQQQTIFEKENQKQKQLKDAISRPSLTTYRDVFEELYAPELGALYLHH